VYMYIIAFPKEREMAGKMARGHGGGSRPEF
jgi:hypothetical protein